MSHIKKGESSSFMPHETKNLSLDQRVAITENWLKWLMRGASVTLAGLLAFAFWLGTISAKVSSSEQTTNKVYAAVSEDPNSLLVRTSVLEHRLTGVETRLTNVETRLTSVEDRLIKVEDKLKSMDAKLNEILMRFDRLERKIR